ncbi:12538_t:CDS:1, partial [Acaulospora morrowiae]
MSLFFSRQSSLIAYPQAIEVKRNTPYIPPEIILVILNMLSDDKKTLASCALVNRTFNLHAIPILYHTISFTFPLTFTRFADTIYCVTECSSLIRHLDLSGFSTC